MDARIEKRGSDTVTPPAVLIPEEIRPRKDQPFYHLLAENDENAYVAYVSEQNLVPDDSGEPVGHPQASLIFESFNEGQYTLRPRISH